MSNVSADWSPCSGARVLVVDDDPDMRKLLGTILEKGGCTTLLAESGEEAIEIACSVRALGRLDIDLLLIDQCMPGRAGLDVLRALRRARVLPPAILMTAYPDDDVRAHALTLGTHVLEKPFTRERLRRLAAILILSKRLDDERQRVRARQALAEMGQ